MSQSHSDLRGDASAYALDSLDAGDRTAFEAHLAECDECAGEVRSLRRVAAALARSVPQPIPPPELRRRVLESLMGGAATYATADRAVAEARLVGAELQASMGVLAAPDLVRIDLAGQPAAPQARGRALWSRARGMVFTATALPPLPAGRVYQVWVVTQPGPVSAGLLTADVAGGGLTFFGTPPDIPPPTAVAVTIEPAGGLPAPTGAFYLVGSPGAAL